MLTIKMTLNNEDINRVLRKLDPDLMNLRLKAGMNEAMTYLQGSIQTKIPIDSGRGRGSVFVNPARGAGVNIRGSVGSPEVHVAVMETGRRPGQRMPPRGPIQLWLRRHGITDPSAVFLVARAIGRRGIWGKGLHMFKRSADQGSAKVAEIVFRRLKGL